MSGDDAQLIWDETEAAREARLSRPLPARIRRMLEMLEDDNDSTDSFFMDESSES